MASIESHAPGKLTPQPATPQPGSGGPPAGGTAGSGRRHWSWRRRFLLALGALVATAVVILAVLAGIYQPVQGSDTPGNAFPGLPAVTGLRLVNTFGGAAGEIYVPPQHGVFHLTGSIVNTGPQTVTILAVSILSPRQQAEDTPSGVAPWPLTPAGTVRWLIPAHASSLGSFPSSVSLAPGQVMDVGIPLRMSGRCYDPNGYAGDSTFYVKERFLLFTHWVAVQFPLPWTFHNPADPVNGSTSASAPPQLPAKDLICPAT
jgi:hypothetical protein